MDFHGPASRLPSITCLLCSLSCLGIGKAYGGLTQVMTGQAEPGTMAPCIEKHTKLRHPIDPSSIHRRYLPWCPRYRDIWNTETSSGEATEIGAQQETTSPKFWKTPAAWTTLPSCNLGKGNQPLGSFTPQSEGKTLVHFKFITVNQEFMKNHSGGSSPLFNSQGMFVVDHLRELW